MNETDERFFEETGRAFMIPGMIWPREMFALRDMFCRSIRHAEIGAFCGKSLYVTAAAMAIYGPSNAEKSIVAVDRFADVFADGLEMLPTVEWWKSCLDATLTAIHVRFGIEVQLIDAPSCDAARDLFSQGKSAFDSVYIDANHSEEYASHDIRCWWPLIRENGLLAGHDYSPECLGTMNAVNNAFVDQFSVIPDTRIWRAQKNVVTEAAVAAFTIRT